MSNVIVECGSAARGDANKNSDIDFVCIWSGSPPDYLGIEKKYSGIMFYSLETIRRMRENGSLFLTHLDIDSIYIEGNKDFLKEFRGYRPPKILVEKSLQDTRDFILEIKWYPDSAIGKLWLCDVLYVSLRNCLYCQNALQERYIFGYEDALKEFSLSASETLAMLDLREGKYMYRKGIISSEANLNVDNFEYTCQAILGLAVKFLAGGNTLWSQNWRKDYWGERLIERAILNNEHEDHGFLMKMKRQNYNKATIKSDIKKIIEMHI